MLIVGWVGWGKPRPTSLTPDEQHTHISLWCMLAAPLLIGSEMTKLDDFTRSLLKNDEVIAVNQDDLGKQATYVIKISEIDGMVADVRVYEKELADGGRAIGLFNLGTERLKVTFSAFNKLHLSSKKLSAICGAAERCYIGCPEGFPAPGYSGARCVALQIHHSKVGPAEPTARIRDRPRKDRINKEFDQMVDEF